MVKYIVGWYRSSGGGFGFSEGGGEVEGKRGRGEWYWMG